MKNMTLGEIKRKEDTREVGAQDQPSSSMATQVDASEAKDDDTDLLPPPPQQVKSHRTIANAHPVDQIIGGVSKGIQT